MYVCIYIYIYIGIYLLVRGPLVGGPAGITMYPGRTIPMTKRTENDNTYVFETIIVRLNINRTYNNVFRIIIITRKEGRTTIK